VVRGTGDEQVVVGEGRLSSLKHFKKDVNELSSGHECGLHVSGVSDYRVGDIVQCITSKSAKRKLTVDKAYGKAFQYYKGK
jgi:translation initiation factor IF-2